MVYIFLGLIVLGMIFGSAIKIGTPKTPTSTPATAAQEEKDFDNLLKLIYSINSKTTKQEFKTTNEEGEREKLPYYKVEEKQLSDGNKYRMVGPYLNLNVNSSIDNELKEVDMYGPNGTKNGAWILEEDVDTMIESLLLDMIDKIKEKATAKGVTLTTYQIYAIAAWHYDSTIGAVSAIDEYCDDWIKRTTYFDFNKYYGNRNKVSEEDLKKIPEDDSDWADYFTADSMPDEIELFLHGYFTSSSVYCAK